VLCKVSSLEPAHLSSELPFPLDHSPSLHFFRCLSGFLQFWLFFIRKILRPRKKGASGSPPPPPPPHFYLCPLFSWIPSYDHPAFPAIEWTRKPASLGNLFMSPFLSLPVSYKSHLIVVSTLGGCLRPMLLRVRGDFCGVSCCLILMFAINAQYVVLLTLPPTSTADVTASVSRNFTPPIPSLFSYFEASDSPES